MRAYIHKLQSKEVESRKAILVGTLTVCMVFVGFVFASSLGAKFNSGTGTQVQEDLKPFKLFTDSVSNSFSNISASVGDISFSKKDQPKEQRQINVVPVEPSNQ